MDRLTVKARIVASFAALTAMVVLVAGVSWRAVSHEHAAFQTFAERTTARALVAEDFLNAANARAIAARNLLLVRDAAEVEKEKVAVTAAHTAVVEKLAELERLVAADREASDRERERLRAVAAVEAKYAPVALSIVKTALDGRQDEATARLVAECRPLLDALVKAGADYIGVRKEIAAASIAEAKRQTRANMAAMGVVSALAALLAVALGWSITRNIARALGAEPAQLSAVAQQVAAGDLTARGELAAAGATGGVAGTLDAMRQALAGTVAQVRAAGASIVADSEQVAGGAADLARRTEQQTESLQRTAASMEELSATVATNADSARQAAQLAEAASSAAARSGEVVGRVVTTMGEIRESAERIADIIGVIDGIAFQTNILALNAAVEAARAGDAGRGFAVVASEVRALAGRSAQAATQVKTLIGQSVQRVEAGSALADEAGSTMGDAVSQSTRVAQLIGEISAATAEQAGGISQVTAAVSQLDQVTQDNARLVDQSAAVARRLQESAADLAQAMGRFTT